MSELTVDMLRRAKRELLDTDPGPVEYTFFHPSLRRGKSIVPITPRLWFDESASVTKASWSAVLDPLNWKGENKVTTKKVKQEKFNTIGVRFPEHPGKEYTYKVRTGAKPYLGQELVADTPRGQAVVFVTRIDKTPRLQDAGFSYAGLKYIDRKAVPL